MQETQQFYQGYDGDHTLYVFYEVDNPLQPQELSISDILNLPAQPFVTITPVANDPLSLELWFHLNLNVLGTSSNVTFISSIPDSVLKIFAEPTGNNDAVSSVNCKIESNPQQRNVFILHIDADAKATNYLRVVFPVDDLKVQIAPDKTSSLREYSTEQRIKFDGFNGKDAIVVYVRTTPIPQEAHG
jgi:hypothetical protein